MKKIALLSAIFGFLHLLGNAQSKMEFLDVNNIKAGINANGQLFYSEEESTIPNPDPWPWFVPAFEVPKGSSKTAIWSGNLWVAGRTPGGSLKSAIHLFNSNADFQTGPIANQYDLKYDQTYNRLWKVDRQMIEEHSAFYQSSDYEMPEVIRNWPGNGDVANGEAAMLAPFVDLNSNNIYEPELGDYPCIKGDQAVFSISNDLRVDDFVDSDSMRIEVHLMAYAFNTNNAENNAIYVNYKIYNRSTTNYSSVYLGLHVDGDVGCGDDDYVGSDSTRNAFFFYNGDDFDADCRGIFGYGSRTPAVGAILLNRKMRTMMSFRRGSGPIGDPRSTQEYYNYLTGRWRDSTHLTFDSIGHLGTIATNYMYPGDPRDTNQWSDAKFNPPFDRTGVGSSGPFSLNTGNWLEFDVAFVYAEPPFDTTSFEAIDYLKQSMTVVQNIYNTRTSNCYLATAVEELDLKASIKIYPNPARERLSIDFGETLPIQASIVNLLGEHVQDIPNTNNVVDVSALPNGVYFLRFDFNQEVVVKRFVISN